MNPSSTSDNPIYDSVRADLDVNPVVVGGRPKWSFEEACQRLEIERESA